MRKAVLAYVATLCALLGASAVGGLFLLDATGPDDVVEDAADDRGYDFVLWEVEHFPRKWIYKAHTLLFGEDSGNDDQVLRRYFGLTEQIQAQRLPGLERERNGLEGAVEDIIEGRVTAVLEGQALAIEPPLFSDLGLVFPPVDFELDSPPRVLAISPRDRIELERSFLLEPGLKREEFAGVEREAESKNGPEGAGVSALIVGTGGVGTYPALINADDGYHDMVETAFHEWLHNYLVFFPLGRSYFSGNEARTLNESVANIGGRALAQEYFKRYGEPVGAATGTDGRDPTFDFTTEMRALRREVEKLLSDGRIVEAEAEMEERRIEFQQHGYLLRKINQAYFAFHGFYADSPGSIDPIGPKLEELLTQAGSPGRFIELVRAVTSRADLDEAVAASES